MRVCRTMNTGNNANISGLVVQSDTSFLWGMRLLPKVRRRAMYAIYAFCRAIDDIADEPGDHGRKKRALNAWRQEIARLYLGQPTNAITQSLVQAIEHYGLPQEEFHAIIDGCETDTANAVSMESLEELTVYVRRVAGAVGILSVHVFGAADPPGCQFATNLGAAFQLTNILRDIREDAARRRMYMPHTVLTKHGVPTTPFDAILEHAGFAGAFTELAAMAHQHYDEADRLLAQLPRRRMKPAIIMRAVYRSIFNKLEAGGWLNHEPVRLTPRQKLWLAVRHGLL